MSGILRYFQPTSSLPTAADTGIGEAATRQANRAIERVIAEGGGKKKRKRYTAFSEEQRARIGKYAAENGNNAALKRFRHDIEDLGESTVRLFKNKYLEAVKASPNTVVSCIPTAKRGKPLALGELDAEVQKFVRALRKAGTPVNTAVILAAAEGIVTARDRTLLVQNGGSIKLTKTWAASLMERMRLVKRRGSTSKKNTVTDEEFEAVRCRYLTKLAQQAHANQVPPQLIINWDQTGLNVVPTSTWTMEEEGSQKVEIVGLNDKRQITATLAVAMTGEVLPVQILYAGKTNRCHPSYTFPPDFDIWHTPNHWANAEAVTRLVTNIILPYISAVRARMDLPPSHPAIVIYDAFRGHSGSDLQQLLCNNHVISVPVPNNCTDRLQPVDLSVNKAVKDHLRQCFTSWYAEQVHKQLSDGKAVENIKVDLRLSVMKELEAKWIVSCYDYLCANTTIGYNGYKKAGIIDAIQSGPPVADMESDQEDPFADLEED